MDDNTHRPRRLSVPFASLRVALAVALTLLAVGFAGGSTASAETSACTLANEIVCENLLAGTPRSVWGVAGDGDPSIQGFATDISVDQGASQSFKIKTDASAYELEIYRIGYYGGDGARLVDTLSPSATLPQAQPECLRDTTTGLIDCGNWAVSASWQVPADAVSGVYVARLERADTGGESHILFVVRDDDGGSNLLVQTSDTTWNAYNNYGGVSLYNHGSSASWWSGRCYKVSYNRPLIMREAERFTQFFSAEYPMIRWLERNGYDVSYFTGVDTVRLGAELQEHKAFLSVGHDEYWSAEQRQSVEEARASGVNLAFFSGNEVFWKTRWEASIDGTSTSHRTLVSYKETAANAKIDPSGVWTGTWRDARFSPPADGGRPENALTGTIYTVNAYRTDPIRVPAAEGRLRLWRNTGIESLAPGTEATLPAGVLGYEWDEDLDNGARPPGLMRLSSTTVDVQKHLKDNGSTYGPGTPTHALTLYRAPSGALVFGAGTVQWSWGLDGSHDNDGPDPDPRMQQATVNLFADMSVQPGSLQPGLVAATPTSDTSAPTVAIMSPTAGTQLPGGEAATITGTATDSGGVVGGVEVSVNGGTTWHPASGRESWTYTGLVSGFGPVTILARAVDDSGNLGANASVSAVAGGCPCSLWPDSTTPVEAAFSDSQSYELGVKFSSDLDGYVTGIRFYKGPGNTGTHKGHLWSAAGAMLGEVVFTNETETGWQKATFASPIPIQANTVYVASYYAPVGRYALNRPYFVNELRNAPLRAPAADATGVGNGVFISGPSAFPTRSKQSSNYWVDVVFDQTATDHIGPSVMTTKPENGAASAGLRTSVTATFDETVDPASVNAQTLQLRAPDGQTVPSSVSYDSTSKTATLEPTTILSPATTYIAVVRGGALGVRDVAGNALAADVSWSFRTFSCPCSLWPATVPAETSFNDTVSYELGFKFRSELNGYITAVRFYKGTGNTGTHRGHLWSASGTMLGEVVFTNETATGWQTARFSTPIAIQANTTYVASYFAPYGRYAMNRPYFTKAYENGPLKALADGADGGNGVFINGPTSAFPTKTRLSSNYWVDVVYEQTASDTIPPGVVSTTPTNSATSIGVLANASVTFDEQVDPASINSQNFELRGPGGAVIPASVTYDPTARIATLDPAVTLSAATTYSAVVRGGPLGVRDPVGNALAADYSWTFTTFACPCSLWPTATPAEAAYPDTVSYELGVKFRSDLDGYVTGIRFYKGTANTGTHKGHLWTTDGTMLGEVVFTNETASGWQVATFATAIPIQANTTYVASYYAPNGRYAMNRPYFTTGFQNGPLRALADGAEGGNGVFINGPSAFPTKTKLGSNYWVDVAFSTTP